MFRARLAKLCKAKAKIAIVVVVAVAVARSKRGQFSPFATFSAFNQDLWQLTERQTAEGVGVGGEVVATAAAAARPKAVYTLANFANQSAVRLVRSVTQILRYSY